MKLIVSLHLKVDGWNTMNFPFGAIWAYFQVRWLSVSGSVPQPKKGCEEWMGDFFCTFKKKNLGASQLYSGEQT